MIYYRKVIPESRYLVKMSKKIRSCIESLQPYNAGKPIEELEREMGIKNIIKLASNENPLGPSPKAVEAMKAVAGEMNYYPDSSAYYLREKLAKKHNVKADEILVGNGSDEIVALISEMMIEPGDEAIMSEHTFVRYEMAMQLMGGKSVIVPATEGFGHNLPAMKKAITSKTKIIFICNPNNPTGTMLTQKEIDEFMVDIPEDIVVIFDEAYYEFVTDPDYAQSMKYFMAKKNVMILRTFSKIYGLAGLRVGYAITDKEWVANINKVRPPFNVNRIAQAAAIASLDDKDHVEKSRELNTRGREYLYQQFEQMGIKYTKSQANFILIDTGKDGRDVYQKLLEQGVIIRPMVIRNHPHHVRITIGTMEQNIRFIESLKKLY
jgi:histidinol-phosphate aminotransferase